MLQQLIKLLDYIEAYAEQILNNEKTLDISSTVAHIKNASELNNRIVVKSYRPTFLFKTKLEHYNLSYNAINSIINEVENYLETNKVKIDEKIYCV